jgi:hypothetical protein
VHVFFLSRVCQTSNAWCRPQNQSAKRKKNLTSSESPAAKPNLQQPTHVMKKWEPDRGGNGREKTATPRDEKKETEVGMNEKNRTGARGEPGVVRARADRVPPGRLVGALV